MRPLAVVTLALVALTLLPLPAANAAPHGKCGEPGYPGIVQAGPAYVDVRGPNQGVWVYLESNGLSGLQRGDQEGFVPGDKDTCTDDSSRGPDTLIF